MKLINKIYNVIFLALSILYSEIDDASSHWLSSQFRNKFF